MKTSEEMARSVLGRAKAKRAAKKRLLLTGAAAVLCVCALLISAVDFKTPTSVDGPQPLPVVKNELSPAKIALVRYAAEPEKPVALAQGVQTPYAMEIRVWDTREMTEEEIEDLKAAEEKYAKELVAEYLDPGEDYQFGVHDGKNAVVTMASAGHFFVEIEDYKQVENLRIFQSGDGALAHIGLLDQTVGWEAREKEYGMDYWHVAIQSYQFGGVSFIWRLSSYSVHKLIEDPTIPLSSFSDTLTVTVNMKDGSQQVGIIDIRLSDDGEVFATYRGDTTTV